MKYWPEILCIGFFGVLSTVWLAPAGVIPGIVVGNKVTTGNSANTHPVADSNEIQGGPMQFQFSSELRTIPESRKRKGMLVYISQTDAYYKAYSTNGHYWQRFTVSGNIDTSGLATKPEFYAYTSTSRLPAGTFQQYTTIPRLTVERFGRYTTLLRLPVYRFVAYTSAARTRFIGYSSHVARTYASQAMIASHNTMGSSHNGHFVDTNNPHNVTAAQTGAVSTGTFSTYQTATDAAIAAKQSKLGFDVYTSQHKGTTQGPQGIRGYDGREALRAVILNGFLTVQYDADGLNPQVSSANPFAVYLFEGSNAVASDKILSYDWYIPAVDTQLTYPAYEVDGMQIHRQTFAPGVYSKYSSGKSNNYVKATVTHVSGRQASVSVPVSITKQGGRGYTGPQGAAASVTADSVFGAFSTHRSDKVLVFRPLSSTQGPLLGTKDKGGNARWWVDGLGYMHFMDDNGFGMIEMQSDGTIKLLYQNQLRLQFKSGSPVTIFRNGVPVYEVYSTGRWKGQEGYGKTATKIFPYVRPDGYRSYTSIVVNPVTQSTSATVTRYLAYSTYHTVGKKFGTYSSMKSINSRYYGSTELAATPGFTFEVLFKGIDDFNKVELLEQYNGSAGHNVDIQIYNYLSSSWQTLETITTQAAITQKIYTIMGAQPFLSGTNARLRFNHTSAGTVTHNMLVDYVSLTRDTGAGMPAGDLKSLQYNRAGSFAGTYVNYTTVVTGGRTNARMMLPAGVTNIDFVNQRRQVVFSIRSSGGVVVGGS